MAKMVIYLPTSSKYVGLNYPISCMFSHIETSALRNGLVQDDMCKHGLPLVCQDNTDMWVRVSSHLYIHQYMGEFSVNNFFFLPLKWVKKDNRILNPCFPWSTINLESCQNWQLCFSFSIFKMFSFQIISHN